jgi:hypothetical protein
MKTPSQEATTEETITTLTQLVAHTCFCKLKATCADKNSPECLRHRNLYAEFMLQKAQEHQR